MMFLFDPVAEIHAYLDSYEQVRNGTKCKEYSDDRREVLRVWADDPSCERIVPSTMREARDRLEAVGTVVERLSIVLGGFPVRPNGKKRSRKSRILMIRCKEKVEKDAGRLREWISHEMVRRKAMTASIGVYDPIQLVKAASDVFRSVSKSGRAMLRPNEQALLDLLERYWMVEA